MRSLIFVVALLFLLALATMGPVLAADASPAGGTVPPYTIWMPVVGQTTCKPVVTYRYGYATSGSFQTKPFILYYFLIDYERTPWHDDDDRCTNEPRGIYQVYPDYPISPLFFNMYECFEYPGWADSPYVGSFLAGSPSDPAPYTHWNVKVKCDDGTWSDWLGWEPFDRRIFH